MSRNFVWQNDDLKAVFRGEVWKTKTDGGKSKTEKCECSGLVRFANGQLVGRGLAIRARSTIPHPLRGSSRRSERSETKGAYRTARSPEQDDGCLATDARTGFPEYFGNRWEAPLCKGSCCRRRLRDCTALPSVFLWEWSICFPSCSSRHTSSTGRGTKRPTHFSEIVPKPKRRLVGRGLASRRDKMGKMPSENHCSSLTEIRGIVTPFGSQHNYSFGGSKPPPYGASGTFRAAGYASEEFSKRSIPAAF